VRILEEAPPEKFFSAQSHEGTQRFLALVEQASGRGSARTCFAPVTVWSHLSG
jgi:hypothetical protein